MSNDKDIPDIPPEIARRGAIGLTVLAAQQSKNASGVLLGDDGITPLNAPTQVIDPKKEAAARDAARRAQVYTGAAPCKGMTPAQIEAVYARDYDDAPPMSKELGDRTEVFVNWLWAVKPWDAAKRFYVRGVWPTKLPKVWPPKEPDEAVPATAGATGEPKLYTEAEAKAIVAGFKPRMYSQAEVDEMIAQAQRGGNAKPAVALIERVATLPPETFDLKRTPARRPRAPAPAPAPAPVPTRQLPGATRGAKPAPKRIVISAPATK